MSVVSMLSTLPQSGPCAPARSEVDSRCADAERLSQAAVAHQQRLRTVKQELMRVSAQREADARVRDRRELSAVKDEARKAYRAALIRAATDVDLREAARVWLQEIDRLNRQVEIAERRSEDVTRRANELEKTLPGVELAADAARISAEAARAGCMNARRTLIECEESTQRDARADPMPPRSESAPGTQAAPARRGAAPITLVLRGDRATLLTLALRLAEETGVEAGRLQLLLLELREAIAARALEGQAFRFPDHHPYWGQFSLSDGRLVAANLAAMGYRFDGRDSWVDGHAPPLRELSMAVSNIGLDSRTLRRPADQAAIDSMWVGTKVEVEAYLADRAPDLELDDVMACLGAQAAPLGELWDIWGRLRPLLLTPA